MISRTRNTFAGVALVLAAAAAEGRADVLELKEGSRIECEVLGETDQAYRVRTTTGIFDIEKDRVVTRTPSAPPWEKYQAELKATPDTAEGQYTLSRWCRRHGLRTEQRTHLQRAIELDPDHAAARAALGFVQKDGKWVHAVTKPKKTLSDADREAIHKAKKDEQVVRKAIAEWHVRIQAIFRGRLEGEGSRSDKFRDGRRQILAIDDPLAIPALTKILSQGGTACRHLLVEALAAFPQDEATMNLIVVTVLDPSPRVRREAALVLDERKDPRVVAELRGALASEEEFVLRNAASALGVLRAREAVEDLIPILSTVAVQNVEIALPVFLDSVYGCFGAGCRYRYAGDDIYYRPEGIGVVGPAYPVGTVIGYETRVVDVHRTEVQEALIAITGQNFGFDADAWREWWRRNGNRE